MQTLLLVALILLVGVTAFALQNPTPVTIRFLNWTYPTNLAMAMIAAMIVGGVVVYIASLFAQRDLRARLRSAEARVADLERQRAAAPSDETRRFTPS